MAFRTRDHSDLSKFGNRLLTLMDKKAEQEHIKLDTAAKLAALLYDNKLITVNHHARNADDEAFDEKDMIRMAKASIARQIQKHINADSADIVSGDYINAYCRFFSCSADFLFGFDPIVTNDLTSRQICRHTGLSEQAVSNLRSDNQHSVITDISRLCWSRILESDLFFTIPQNLMTAENEAKEFFRHKAAIDAVQEITKDLDQSLPEYYIHTGKIKPLRKAGDGHRAAYYGMLYKLSQDIINELDPLLEEKISNEKYYEKKYRKLLRQFGGVKYVTQEDSASDDEQGFELHEHFFLNPNE